MHFCADFDDWMFRATKSPFPVLPLRADWNVLSSVVSSSSVPKAAGRLSEGASPTDLVALLREMDSFIALRKPAAIVVHFEHYQHFFTLVGVISNLIMAQAGFDRRRVYGPNESFQPIFDDDYEERGLLYKGWKPGQTRRNRRAEDIRPICARYTAISLFFLLNKGDADSFEDGLHKTSQRLCIY